MKKLITLLTVGVSMLFGTPTYAYTVQSGDTMSKIAQEHNLNLQELATLNPQVEDLDKIYVGQTVHTYNQDKEQSNNISVASTVPNNVERPLLAYSNVSNSSHTKPPALIAASGKTTEENAATSEPTSPAAQHLAQKIIVTKDKEEQKRTTLTKKIKPKHAATTARYSKTELDLLARLVRAEASTEPFAGKIAVACVVLNRVENKAFPDSIRGVIYQKRQFQPVQNGQINKPADADSIKAVQQALNEKRNLAGNSLYFYNPAIATSRWLDSRPTTFVIGQHVFKK
ncbi:cell wall hydrolase [Bacillus rubiinfantis]|uniref:cell wall hydrolase n=1 Tax=Bacillus rubiinfantis TaxID=1499680 RepID=UPI0005AB3BF7|nr:cell wall hydrolase [Bacillus rubiinfantis]